MAVTAKPSQTPAGDGDPGSDEPAPFNQQTDVGEARAVNPAPIKLYDQHNTQQAMPVHTRTKAAAQSPLGRGAVPTRPRRARREPRLVPIQ